MQGITELDFREPVIAGFAKLDRVLIVRLGLFDDRLVRV